MSRTATRRRPPRPRKADQTSLYVRGLEPSVVREIRSRAGARNLTIANYPTRIVAFHAAVLDPDDGVSAASLLDTFGLGRVEM